MRTAPLRLLVLILILAAPLALAQETSPVLLERTSAEDATADVGQPARAVYRLFSLNPTDDFYVSIATDAPSSWKVTPSADRFFLGPRNQTEVEVLFEPSEALRGEVVVEVTFSFVQGSTGQVTRVSDEFSVHSSAPPRVLGIVPNPLAAPLDNAYGTFLLDMLAWAIIGVGVVFLGNWLVRLSMARAKGDTAQAVVAKLSRPVFIMIILLGLSWSFAGLPRNPATSFISKFLLAIAVTVFGLYVLYRSLDAALVYYQREIAPRTSTKVDDVLVPAFRKVGLMIIYVAGIVLTLRTLGWDPTLIFAGAGIAGLVLAFAAQDTFSNLFSGIFLMLDRPFVEGDVILLETGEVARVEQIGLRTTDLYEYDHHHVITVPNNQLATRRIVNYSAPDTTFRVDIFVGAAYGSDVPKVERILREVALAEPELVNIEQWAPQVQLREFADSQMTFMLRVTLKDPRDRNRVPSRVRMAIARRFAEEGIEIPYPQRVVHVRNDG